MPLLGRLVAGLSQRRPRFDPMVVYVVVEESMVQVFLRMLSFSALSIISRVPHTHISFICNRRCIISAADYSVLDIRLQNAF